MRSRYSKLLFNNELPRSDKLTLVLMLLSFIFVTLISLGILSIVSNHKIHYWSDCNACVSTNGTCYEFINNTEQICPDDTTLNTPINNLKMEIILFTSAGVVLIITAIVYYNKRKENITENKKYNCPMEIIVEETEHDVAND